MPREAAFETKDIRAVNHKLKLQNILAQRNNGSLKVTVLHLLAAQTALSEEDQTFLDLLLGEGSLAKCYLTQHNATEQSPICLAILNQNIDFIRQVLQSQAALKTPWSQLIDTQSAEMLKAINQAFDAASRAAYDVKQFPQAGRFAF